MIRITSITQAENLIGRSIARMRPVTLTYTRADGVETIRTVEPYGEIRTSKAGDLYFKAMDRESGECRSWRLDRITFLTIHRTYFLIKNPTNETEVFMAVDNEKTETQVRVTRMKLYPEVARRGPAWRWSYDYYVDGGPVCQYGPGLTSLRGMLRSRFGRSVQITQDW